MRWEKLGEDVSLAHGDCLEAMEEIEEKSIGAVITDPPYPEIDRDYGKLSVGEWRQRR